MAEVAAINALAELVRQALAGKVAYNRQEAADAVGLGYDSIKRAIGSGRLEEHFPLIDGRPTAKGVILADDLAAWVAAGPTEREAS